MFSLDNINCAKDGRAVLRAVRIYLKFLFNFYQTRTFSSKMTQCYVFDTEY